MIITFEEDYLRELYEDGEASDKKHRFQPSIIKKYTRVVDLMMEEVNVIGLRTSAWRQRGIVICQGEQSVSHRVPRDS